MANGLLLSEIHETVMEHVETINLFDKKCNEEEHTDIGIVWELFYAMRESLRDLADEIVEEAARRGEPFNE